MEGEGEDGDDDLEESMRASQWECNSQWSPYSQFLSRLMSSTIVALWPESPALLLPKFLTSGHCYAALLVTLFVVAVLVNPRLTDPSSLFLTYLSGPAVEMQIAFLW